MANGRRQALSYGCYKELCSYVMQACSFVIYLQQLIIVKRNERQLTKKQR